MTDNVINLPGPGVILDLDNEERPESEIKPPFIVKVGSKNITFKDPADIDWRDLASIELPADLIRVALSQEDRRHLHDQPLPGWKFNRLMSAYETHYDLEQKILDAKRRRQFNEV